MYIYICIHTYIYTCTYRYRYRYTYRYIYTYIHTNIHTNTHTHTQTESSVAKYLFDPAVSLEPYILEGFIRCIQEVYTLHPKLYSINPKPITLIPQQGLQAMPKELRRTFDRLD